MKSVAFGTIDTFFTVSWGTVHPPRKRGLAGSSNDMKPGPASRLEFVRFGCGVYHPNVRQGSEGTGTAPWLLAMACLGCSDGPFYPGVSDIPVVLMQVYEELDTETESKSDGYMQVYCNSTCEDNFGFVPAETFTAGPIGIKIRGQSSCQFPKHNYTVELRRELGNNDDEAHPLFGFDSESDWVFHCPYQDRSLLRNHLAFFLAAPTRGGFEAQSMFFELAINGDYEGLFLLEEKIKASDARLPITYDSSDPSETGYLMKLDTFDDGEYVFATEDYGIELGVVFPDTEDLTGAHALYATDAIASLESRMLGLRDDEEALASSIDVDSFVDQLLLQEWSMDVDSFRKSQYLHVTEEGLVRIGPPWDFNLAFGNHSDEHSAHDGTLFDSEAGIGQWYVDLLETQTFSDAVMARWNELRAGPWSDASIDAFFQTNYVLVADARERNFERWQVLGTTRRGFSGPAPATYDEEFDLLVSWVEDRAVVMDERFAGD